MPNTPTQVNWPVTVAMLLDNVVGGSWPVRRFPFCCIVCAIRSIVTTLRFKLQANIYELAFSTLSLTMWQKVLFIAGTF